MDQWSTAMYYAFSTASQTLAAAFGFVAAVLLYRMGILENDIRANGDKLKILPIGNDGHYHAYKDLQDGELKKFLNWYNSNVKSLPNIDAHGLISVATIIAYDATMKRHLKKWFWITLGFTSATIVSCLIAITCIPAVTCPCTGKWMLGVIGVFTPVLTLLALLKLSYTAFTGTNQKIIDQLQRQLTTGKNENAAS